MKLGGRLAPWPSIACWTLAAKAGISVGRPEELVTDRARARWQTYMGRAAEHGTVGAVALDLHGQLAASTSTGGITGKMPGRRFGDHRRRNL